jgi:DNA polymerase (family X)
MCASSAIPPAACCCAASPLPSTWGAVLRRAAELGVAVEHNAAPERLDLNDRDLRLAKELGCRIVINSDSHDARNLGKMDYGIRQLRRAWLGRKMC